MKFVKKRFGRNEPTKMYPISGPRTYVTWIVVSFIAFFLDGILGYGLDLYYFFEKETEVRDVFVQLIPGFFGVLVLYTMPRNWGKFLLHIVLWTTFSVLFEALMVRMGLLNYKAWHPVYSVPVYILGILFLRWHGKYIERI